MFTRRASDLLLPLQESARVSRTTDSTESRKKRNTSGDSSLSLLLSPSAKHTHAQLFMKPIDHKAPDLPFFGPLRYSSGDLLADRLDQLALHSHKVFTELRGKTHTARSREAVNYPTGYQNVEVGVRSKHTVSL